MEDSIKSEMSGNLAKTYLALINNIRGRPAYFAREVKKALKGLGTDGMIFGKQIYFSSFFFQYIVIFISPFQNKKMLSCLNYLSKLFCFQDFCILNKSDLNESVYSIFSIYTVLTKSTTFHTGTIYVSDKSHSLTFLIMSR